VFLADKPLRRCKAEMPFDRLFVVAVTAIEGSNRAPPLG
jgi:hypothetical protein